MLFHDIFKTMIKPKKKLSFKEAVERTPDIAKNLEYQLNALGQYSQKVEVADRRKLEGSVDIDLCTSKKYQNAHRWDYVIGFNGEAYLIEVHKATTNEVDTVLQKLKWIKLWLQNEAPEINKIKSSKSQVFSWIQTSKMLIPKTTRQYRLLAQNGLLPVPKIVLG